MAAALRALPPDPQPADPGREGELVAAIENIGAILGLNEPESACELAWKAARRALARYKSQEAENENENFPTSREVVDAQAEDEGLWFIAETAPEAYLQQELRRLHAAVERDETWVNPPTPNQTRSANE